MTLSVNCDLNFKSFGSSVNYIIIKCDCLQTEEEPAMSEMVESTITSHTYVAHVPVPSQKEVTICKHIL